MRVVRDPIALALLWSLFATEARADRPVVGVIANPVVAVGDAERDQLTQDIARALKQQYAVDAKIGHLAGLPEDCVAQPACTSKVGVDLGAQQLLFLVMIKIGTRVQIDPTWVDVSSGRTSARDTIVLEEGGRPRAQILREAAPGLIPRGAAQSIAEATPPPKNPPPPKGDTWREGTPEVTGDSGAPDSEIAMWVAAGISLGTLVAGLALVVAGRADYNDCLEIVCDGSRGTDEILRRYGTRSLVANLLLAGAAAAGATAVALYIDGHHETELGLVVSPDGVTVGVGGTF